MKIESYEFVSFGFESKGRLQWMLGNDKRVLCFFEIVVKRAAFLVDVVCSIIPEPLVVCFSSVEPFVSSLFTSRLISLFCELVAAPVELSSLKLVATQIDGMSLHRTDRSSDFTFRLIHSFF